MNDQLKKDAEYLRQLAREKKNIDWVRIRQIADHIEQIKTPGNKPGEP